MKQKSSSGLDCIIVGSGINALVCAALLGRTGRRVLLLERNSRPGGCIHTGEVTLPGFVHDVLSCWHPLFVTSPAWARLKPDLERCGVRYRNTETPTAVVRGDGSRLVLHRSRDANVSALNALSAGEGDRWAAAMADLERNLELVFLLLGGDLRSPATLRGLVRHWWKLGTDALLAFAGESLEPARAWLERSFRTDLVRACLAPWVLHAGQNVEEAGSARMAQIIPFTLEAAGAPVVEGGGERLVEAFVQIIRAQGGELITDADVERVLVGNGVARGVVTADGREFTAREAVICSVTPGQLYGRLLGGGGTLPEAGHYRHGRAGMQIHVALGEPARWMDPVLDGVALVHLADGIDSVSRAVNEAERGLLPAEGTIVVGQPAVLDPSRVPEGRGMLWIQILDLPQRLRGDAAGMIPCPANGNWDAAVKEAYADRVMAHVARHVRNLDGAVLARTVYSPADLEALNCNLVGGDPYGGACSMDQMLFWRPSTNGHRTRIRGLYHIGASTHPGPGLGGGSGYLLAMRLARGRIP